MPVAATINRFSGTDQRSAAKILENFDALVAVINSLDAGNIGDGTITATELASALLDQVGVTGGGVTRSGKLNILGPESLSSTSYGYLATPDRVTVTLPTDGLIAVWYQAIWQESVVAAARAAIFLGSNQLAARYVANGANTVPGQEARLNAVANQDNALVSVPIGLAGVTTNAAADADVSTGQALGALAADGAGSAIKVGTSAGATPSFPGPALVGGPCYIFAAGGTYTVGVAFKSSSGSVTAKNRKLWVRALAF